MEHHQEPVTELDARFSSDGARATPWATGLRRIEEAELFWLSTVRPDARPHVTPVISVWLDDAAYFCTGADERKAHNLARNPRCALTTGCNVLAEGLDVVIEGDAVRVRDDERLRSVAARYESKYGPEWHFEVVDGAFVGQGGNLAVAFAVVPSTILGFGKGEFSQTRWRFPGR